MQSIRRTAACGARTFTEKIYLAQDNIRRPTIFCWKAAPQQDAMVA
jgi:hypothetical protein